MGGTCVVREEPGKQKPRSYRAQELARSRARENARRKRVLTEIPENQHEEQTWDALGCRSLRFFKAAGFDFSARFERLTNP